MTQREPRTESTLRQWTPDTIPWGEPAADGTRYALLEGGRSRPGSMFTYAFFLPAGFWDPPHWHTQDARIVVVRGRLRFGYGERIDRTAADAFPAGSALHVPARAVHFDGASEDTTIIGVAQGAWGTSYLDPSHEGSAGTVDQEGERNGNVLR